MVKKYVLLFKPLGAAMGDYHPYNGFESPLAEVIMDQYANLPKTVVYNALWTIGVVETEIIKKTTPI